MRRILLAATAALALATAARAEDRHVTIAYQTNATPYDVGIQDGTLARRTGWQIDYRRFNSGAEIFAAIAGGAVDIGDVGSSPLAAALSNGLHVQVVYVTAGAGSDEQLVVRNGSGITTLTDLRGKRLAAAPVSTDHYMFLAVLKQEGIPESAVQFFAIPQPQIVAGWKRGDIDAAFVWDPALHEVLQTGKSLLTAAEVAKRGAPTFGALVATEAFARAHPDFLQSYLHAVDGYFASLRNDPASWAEGSQNARKIAALLGGTPEEQAADLRQVHFIPLSEQVTTDWLGGGDAGGVAKALKSTAEFLLSQHKIGAVLPGYGAYVTPAIAEPGLHAAN